MDRYDLLQCYMIMGGIPYYLSYMQKGYSLAQNIDMLFFQKDGKLRLEFQRLYASLFVDPEAYIKVIKFLGQKREGYTRTEIAQHTGIPYGGGLTKILKSLVVSDFITPYIYYGHSSRDIHYKLTDFILSFIYVLLIRKTLPILVFGKTINFLQP